MTMCPGPERHLGQAYLHMTRLCLFGRAGPTCPRKTVCVRVGQCSPAWIGVFVVLPGYLSVPCICSGGAGGARKTSGSDTLPCGERAVAALIPVMGAVCLLPCEAGGARPPPHCRPTAARQAARCWGPGWVIFSDRGGPAAFN